MASVLVTGTSTGIGLATALALGRAGHRVHATMRNPARAPELAQRVAKEKLPVSVSAMDVDSDSSVKEVFDRIRAEGEHLDALVNNAGIERVGTVEELPLQEFRAVMETNYFGVLRCIHAASPQMRQRRSGCIINVTSVAGRIALSPMAPYTASKWALEALSEALAQEMKPHNVRVAIVEPGIIDTPMAQRIGDLPSASGNPRTRRMAAMFTEALKTPAPPTVVAQKIQEIIESGTWTLRHPVGPDAIPFLDWRRAMSDEKWVDWGAADDETYYQNLKKDFGMDARPKD